MALEYYLLGFELLPPGDWHVREIAAEQEYRSCCERRNSAAAEEVSMFLPKYGEVWVGILV
ncbi:MAG TPA: hypothetical protein VG167_09510 [Verrucomicrobiae bacterium]|nr:hypothetical protein [Verrucomicrobiae bacterium]